jgi:preprotein translocase subunit SecE
MKRRGATARQSRQRLKFFGDTIGELKKVVWLTRREIVYLTGLVLIVAITMGIILGVIDYGFTRLVNDVFLGG